MRWPWTRRRPRVSDLLAEALSEFAPIVHHVAQIGEHVIEFAEGGHSVTVNGVEVNATDLEHFARAMYQAAVTLGVLAPITAAA